MPDAPGGVVHCLGRAREVAPADEADHAVAQVLALQEHEDDEDDDDAGGRKRD